MRVVHLMFDATRREPPFYYDQFELEEEIGSWKEIWLKTFNCRKLFQFIY